MCGMCAREEVGSVAEGSRPQALAICCVLLGYVLPPGIREMAEWGPQLLGLGAEVWRTQK